MACLMHKERMETNERSTIGRSASVHARRGLKAGIRALAVVVLISVAIALYLLLPQTVWAASVPDDFERISAGEFWMGSSQNEQGRRRDENRHRVSLSEFFICRHEVTVGEFRKFIEATGYRTDAEKKGESWNWMHGTKKKLRGAEEQTHPVVNVSWNDAVAYCVWRSVTEGRLYWLPTEAQWEYACRAGAETPFYTGRNLTKDDANYNGYRGTTTPVRSFSPNGWGLYDMHGNVDEWCSDWYEEYYYKECISKGTVKDPQGPSGGTRRVFRGGCWNRNAQYSRSASRGSTIPASRYPDVGFRLVFIPL